MSAFDLIKRTIDDHSELIDFLRTNNEVSFLSTVEQSLPKVILLAAASDLEARTQKIILDYFARSTGNRSAAVQFVANKAVNRQFHTYFDWTKRTANQFFGLFGKHFKERALAECAADERLKESISYFCEVGNLRNQLVHSNYASFSLNLTAAEVFDMYEEALYFVGRMPDLLESHDGTERPLP